MRYNKGSSLPFRGALRTAPSAHLLPVIVWMALPIDPSPSHDELAAELPPATDERSFFPIVPDSQTLGQLALHTTVQYTHRDAKKRVTIRYHGSHDVAPRVAIATT